MIKRKITTCLLIACLVLTAALTAGCGSQAAPESSAQTKEQLADKIEKWGVSGISQIVFVIGGSLGLSKAILNRADYKLSFSKMTFPHQLMRVIL